MNGAVFGFIGVIAGALLSGFVQWASGWSDRVRARHTAARLIWGDLVLATRDLEEFVRERGWPEELWDLPTYTKSWSTHAEAFSRAGTANFHMVAAAFSRIDSLIGIRGRSTDDAKGWSRAALRIHDDIAVVEQAADVALEVGLAWHERWRGAQKWEQYRLRAAPYGDRDAE